MCPDLKLLEQLALGLLSAEESAPLEEHLATCQGCLQTVIERDPSDTIVEALREASRTAERRSVVEDDIHRLQTAALAQLPDPYQTRAGERRAADDLGRSPHNDKNDL